MKSKWLTLILNGIKDLEIRDKPGKTVLGKRIFLCESGTASVYGYATVDEVLGPLSEQDWIRLRKRHCVQGGRIYKKDNYAWVLSGVTRCHQTRIKRKLGSVGSQVGPGHP